ncbi:MAG: hypothetical protein AAGC76_05010 [Luteibacter sp.]|uniref:hypothetical protein n=1 Tax=Luteibacter sp. TaxID=1886636 RepID=UPI00280A4CC8|nr:hypothetical protein [Luteibacter sp.]MDQ7995196.1 hypothetical protein [Luteibacter sp.]
MPRTKKKAEQTTLAIAELLGLASAPGRTDPGLLRRAQAARRAAEVRPMDGKPEYSLLDDAAIQELFQTLPDDLYVGPYLAASYLGCTQLTLERHIRACLEPGAEWSKLLAAETPPRYKKGRFRWSFVREIRNHAANAARQRPSRSKKVPQGSDDLLAFLEQELPFLVLNGKVQAGWGQGGLTAAEFKRLIRAGADLQRLSVVQALTMPWANTMMRQPWQEAAVALLAGIIRSIQRNGSQASADGIVQAMPRRVTARAPDRRL